MVFKIAGNRFVIKPNWKLTVFYLLMMPVLLTLGFWQLDRAAQKEQIQTLYQQRQAATPTTLKVALEADDLAYRRVHVSGRYDNKHLFLLDNKTFRGHAGYEVISAFKLAEPLAIGGTVGNINAVWVNRGWVPQGTSRDEMPKVPAVQSRSSIVGSIYLPEKQMLVLAEQPMSGRWPEVIQRVEVEKMAARIQQERDLTFMPHLLQIEEDSEGVLQRIWQPINMASEKHLGYALQWFSMSAALTILYFFVTVKRVKGDHE